MANGVNANQLHKWRWQYRHGKLRSLEDASILMAVHVLPYVKPKRPASALQRSASEPGHVEFVIGNRRAILHGTVPVSTLCAVIQALES